MPTITAKCRASNGASGPAAPLRPPEHPAATASDLSFVVTGCAIALGGASRVQRPQARCVTPTWFRARPFPIVRTPCPIVAMSHVLDDGDSVERRYAGPPGRTKLLLECARRPAPPPPPRFPGYTRLTISLQGPTLPTSLLHWRSSRQTGSLRTVCSSTRETLMSTLYAYGVQRDEHAVRVRG